MNIYDEIKPYKEFKKLEESEQKKIMTEYQKRHAVGDIIDGLGVAGQTYYNLLKRLELDSSIGYMRPKRKRKAVADMAAENKEREKKIEAVDEENSSIDHEGSLIKFTPLKRMDGDQIAKKLEKFAMILESDESEYEIHLSIKEIG